jgi:poly-beta-hydroxybutyrate-responsive repressor
MKKQSGQGKPERFMQPCLLMTLLEGQSYGYELIQRLGEYGFIQGEAPPGMVYRHLRQMEEEGLVSSAWDAEGSGPARRVYAITADGREVLEAWVDYMEHQAAALESFVGRFRRQAPGRSRS